MWNVGLDETQAGIKIGERNINNFRYVDDTTLTAENKEKLKSLLMKVKEEWKSWLKTQHSKNKIVASGPITSWQIGGESVRDFILGGSKISEDSDCHHEIKRCVLLGRKAMTNLDNVLKSRDTTFSSSRVWRWELDHKEGWALKNWCFWTVVLEKTLGSPLDCKEIKLVNSKGNQS